MSSPIFIVFHHSRQPSLEELRKAAIGLGHSSCLERSIDWSDFQELQRIPIIGDEADATFLARMHWLTDLQAFLATRYGPVHGFDQQVYEQYVRAHGDYVVETSWSWFGGNGAIAGVIHSLLVVTGGILWNNFRYARALTHEESCDVAALWVAQQQGFAVDPAIEERLAQIPQPVYGTPSPLIELVKSESGGLHEPR